MKIEHRRALDGTQEKIVYPDWSDSYCFRAWPRKIDEEFMDKLPDPNKTKREYLELAVQQEFEFSALTEPALDSVTITKVLFRKISLGYQRGNTIVYCYDWEQAK